VIRDVGREMRRREFLRFLAAGPLHAAGTSSLAVLLARLHDPPQRRATPKPSQGAGLASAGDALDVFDLEAEANRRLPAAHRGYLATGVDDDATLRANRDGLARLQLRARRLVDVTSIDTSVRLFDKTWSSPIVLAPVSSQRAFHPEGELAVARAAASQEHLLILSTLANTPVEEVVRASGGRVWYQLYPTDRWEVTRALLQRAERAGCPVVVLTVDLQGGFNRETQDRLRRQDRRDCQTCHAGGSAAFFRRRPMFDGLDASSIGALVPPDLSWDFVKRLRDTTRAKIVLKGIVTREDARLALASGVDGLIVSNHGGRAEESGRSTIEALPEVVEAVQGRIPVLVDGGFRRGTDIFKGLALGATAVGVGRPYCWGLAAFGQQGVEAVLDILRRELRLTMGQAGTTRVGAITKAYLSSRP
jgi:isopentenyl diphosphate isomerase/L-lactate dehydrogenase-like FMN-dependent dehydrogenase